MSLSLDKEYSLSYRPPTKSGDKPFLEGIIKTIGVRDKPVIARIDLLRTPPGLPVAPDINDNRPFRTAIDSATEDPAKPGVPKEGTYLYLDLRVRQESPEGPLTYLADPKTMVAEINEMRWSAYDYIIRWQVERQTAEEIRRLREAQRPSVALVEQVKGLQTQVGNLTLEIDARSPRILAEAGVWALRAFLSNQQYWPQIPRMLGFGMRGNVSGDDIIKATLLALDQEGSRIGSAPNQYRQMSLFCRDKLDELLKRGIIK